MRLQLRNRTAKDISYDLVVEVSLETEWKDCINDPCWISSVLIPDERPFTLQIPSAIRKHPHEKDYSNNPLINQSYIQGCQRLAARLDAITGNARCLIYAPLRGALPIWRGISLALKAAKTTVYHPVTSSFVFYPEHFGIRNKKGRPASGRFNNELEIQRLLPFLEEFDFFVYVDEIVSGGMMRGHLKQIFQLGVHQRVQVIAVGLADSFGRRSQHNRSAFEIFHREGLLHAFLWEGCHTLITEDQKFLLGMHYVDYHLGPHAVPLLDESLGFYREKILFDRECFSSNSTNGGPADPFCAKSHAANLQ